MTPLELETLLAASTHRLEPRTGDGPQPLRWYDALHNRPIPPTVLDVLVDRGLVQELPPVGKLARRPHVLVTALGQQAIATAHPEAHDGQRLLAALKRAIAAKMRRCDAERWPHVCQLKSTPQGYALVEARLIQLAKSEGMPIGSAIALLESEFAHSNKESSHE
ncbi:MAG: hypothetical protein AAGB22_00970 [Bacteroidota bacterium]